MSMPEWVEELRPANLPGIYEYRHADIRKVFEALSIAWEALDKIEQRKLEDLPRDKPKDEFHKTLMASAAWMFCSWTAKEAMRRIEEVEK